MQAKESINRCPMSSSVVSCYISECYSPDLKQSPETYRLKLSSSLGFIETEISGRDWFVEHCALTHWWTYDSGPLLTWWEPKAGGSIKIIVVVSNLAMAWSAPPLSRSSSQLCYLYETSAFPCPQGGSYVCVCPHTISIWCSPLPKAQMEGLKSNDHRL